MHNLTSPRRRSVSCSLLLCGLLATLAPTPLRAAPPRTDGAGLFARDNLIAWCIVPFDSKKRGPEERAAMLERLGFTHFAYDWRGEHIPTFDAEIEALKRHKVALDAFWVAPGELNRESRIILDVLKRHHVKAQLWVLLDFGADRVTGAEQDRRVNAAVTKLKPLAAEAGAIGCSLALYNHGGWFGEPENQIAIIEVLKAQGVTNVGMVYNLHHGHDHLARFPALLAKMKPYLVALNLNGMDPDGDKHGRKILPLGQGSEDLGLLRTIVASGYRGPIGILGHTDDDAEQRLKDNLDGLDWLVPQLEGKPAGPKPKPRTYTPPVKAAEASPYQPERVARLVDEAKAHGDPARGAEVFAAAQFGCLSCHKIGRQGATVGPDLTEVGRCLTPELIVEAVLWPKRQVIPAYAAIAVATSDGRVLQGYKLSETERDVVLRDVATGKPLTIPRPTIEETRELGTLMPDGLVSAMTFDQQRDLVRFLIDLGRTSKMDTDVLLTRGHTPSTFPYDLKPIHPEDYSDWQHHVNRDRVYDFYQKEAEYFANQPSVPSLLPAFPGLDNGKYGHWGNQNEDFWKDDRWNKADLGTLLSGVFRGAGVTVPKGVCVRLGTLSVCFNSETLCYEALWSGGFVKFSAVRHGFMEGLILDGTPLPRPEGKKPTQPFVYHGFYRHGNDVVFSYRIGDTEMLDAPRVEGGKFVRIVGPAKGHPLANQLHGGPTRWPRVFETKGQLGKGCPYAIDTIEPPNPDPWNLPLFFGDHDFLADGTAMVCTIQGDVWRVDGLDATLGRVRWKRFATGLHQALGLVVVGDKVHVLGRDQITRLHDLDGDGEADFHECVTNAYATSPSGHDFICGLQRDAAGNFYTASGSQGILRITPDGKRVDVLATGFRNADGLGLSPDGVLTVPSSEGDWTMASMIAEVREGGHYGYAGTKDGKVPDLPLVYLPRGLDNSSGAQTFITSDRWGPLKGLAIHLSYGTGTHFLLLRDRVGGQPQGAVVPLPGDFRSGVHRGRFSPKDGQLYVTGMGGWGTYTAADGCFQRVRYTGDPVQLPVALHTHENGIVVKFSRPVDPSVIGVPKNRFAQVWNYRYGPAYGSPELSPRHPGVAGHDPLAIRSATVLDDGRSVFLEMPDLQPVNQLHLHLRVDDGPPRDLFATVHKLDAPFTGFPGYRPSTKQIAAHPILVDLASARQAEPNPWRSKKAGARPITIEAGKNLTFSVASLKVRAGEPIKLTFLNPDAVPHNWVLIRPGTLPKVGELSNRMIAEPDAVARHYVPKTDDVIAFTDIVSPQDQMSIYFDAPAKPGRYPFLCTFPGHWMVMNGVMVVE
jgi:putative heme-binding domain-containing protein